MYFMSVMRALTNVVRALIDLGDPAPALNQLETAIGNVGESGSELRSAVSALTVRNLKRSERETQLRGLLRTSEELLSVSAVDELLNVIARDTRRQLESDVAHLNLLDASGAARTRTCVGAVTPAFRHQRTASGAGLTGYVKNTRRAYVVEDYSTDPQLRHDPSGDRSVAEEGIRTLAAVPLFGADEVIGVLVASYRQVRPVSDEQMDTLASLGALASVALSTAQLYEEKENALKELHGVNDVLEHSNSLLQWSSSAHDRLTGLILDGADLETIAMAVSDLISGTVVVLDEAGTPILSYPSDDVSLPLEARSRPGESRRIRRLSVDEDAMWIAPVTAAGTSLGSLVVIRASGQEIDMLSSIEERTLERAATVCALRLLLDRSVAEGDRRVAGEVVEDLLAGGERSARAASRANDLGFDASGPCVVLEAEGETNASIRNAGQVFAQSRGGLSAWRPGRLTVLLPQAVPQVCASELYAALEQVAADAVWVGASEVSRGVQNISIAYRDAKNCALAVKRLERKTGWGTPAELGFIGRLLTSNGPSSLRQQAIDVLDSVLAYDERHGTELSRTLDAYIQSGQSLQSAAKQLSVHRNTVFQRLEKVRQLLGIERFSPENMLDIHIALEIHRLTLSADFI
jgi:hypothetical protein